MRIGTDDEPKRDQRRQAAWVVGGVVLGLVAGLVLYAWLNPALEGRDDWLEEFQGLLFNVIPLAAALGGALAWSMSRRFVARKR